MKSTVCSTASVRVITENLPRLVRFYKVLTGATPQYLTDDFVELVTPSATFAVSGSGRMAFITVNTPRGGANHSAIVEFLVDDTEAVYQRLVTEFGDDLDVVQPPTMMSWGNLSALIRDPDGALINLYTPVTPEGRRLQHNRTPSVRLSLAAEATPDETPTPSVTTCATTSSAAPPSIPGANQPLPAQTPDLKVRLEYQNACEAGVDTAVLTERATAATSAATVRQ